MTLVRIRETGEVQTANQFIRWLKSQDGGNTSIPDDRLTPEIMDAHGADPVNEGPQPSGEMWQHVEPDGIEQVAGQWRTKWKLVPDTAPEDWLEQRKLNKKQRLVEILNQHLTGGYTHDFGGEIGEKVLQTRNIEDRTNWLTSQASYSAAIAAGYGAVPGAKFRTGDNITIELSYSDGLGVLLAMVSWGASLMDNSWRLKDLIAAASTEEELDAIEIESGWTQ